MIRRLLALLRPAKPGAKVPTTNNFGLASRHKTKRARAAARLGEKA
jgi:hypothetical protein